MYELHVTIQRNIPPTHILSIGVVGDADFTWCTTENGEEEYPSS